MEELRSPAISLGLEGDCIWVLLRVLLSVVVKDPEEEALRGRLSDRKTSAAEFLPFFGQNFYK